MRKWIAALALAVVTGCGGGGGDGGGKPQEQTFRIPDDISSGFYNYLVGSVLVSVTADADGSAFGGFLQSPTSDALFVFSGTITSSLSASIGAVLLDVDGNVNTTSDLVVLGAVSGDDGISFSLDGTEVTLNFDVVNLDASRTHFGASGDLLSVTSNVPSYP